MPNHPFVPIPLLADAGVPMILLTWPAMVALVIPVIAIESLLCKRWLGLKTWPAVKSNAVSNVASTIIGTPIAWAIMLGIEFAAGGALDLVEKVRPIQDLHSPIANAVFFILSSAWLGPTDKAWEVAAATLVLLVPFFVVSYLIEYRIVRSMVGVPDGEPANLAYPRVRIAVRNANLVTYGLMFVGTSVWLAILLRHK